MHGASGGADDGLTLIEMVVAIGVLMIVLVSSLAVFITVQKSQQTAEGTDRAIQLANSRLERIRQLDWQQIGFYQNTYNATTSGTNYTTYVPSGEATIILGSTDPNTVEANKIKPYEVTAAAEARNTFTVYTTITWGRDPSLGLPSTSATTASGQYSFRRVRVTVIWKSNGNGATHKVVTESWFAPKGFHEAPPGVPVANE